MNRPNQITFSAFLLVAIISVPLQAQWYKISKHDLRDTRDKVRQGLRDIDPTNRNGSLREHLRKNDPVENLKEKIYADVRDDVLTQIADRAPVTFAGCPHHRQLLLDARDSTGQPLFQAAELDGVQLYFGCNLSALDNAAGVTFGNRILIAQAFQFADPDLTQLLAHELVHVRQVRRMGGEENFDRKYVSQALHHTLKLAMTVGLSDHNRSLIHDMLELEQEAINVESQWREWNSSNYRTR